MAVCWHCQTSVELGLIGVLQWPAAMTWSWDLVATGMAADKMDNGAAAGMAADWVMALRHVLSAFENHGDPSMIVGICMAGVAFAWQLNCN